MSDRGHLQRQVKQFSSAPVQCSVKRVMQADKNCLHPNVPRRLPPHSAVVPLTCETQKHTYSEPLEDDSGPSFRWEGHDLIRVLGPLDGANTITIRTVEGSITRCRKLSLYRRRNTATPKAEKKPDFHVKY